MADLNSVIADINKKYKSEIVVMGTKRIKCDKIPFTSPKLNWMTYGGIPRGKCTEIMGPENGGKTTTALDIVKNAQQLANAEYDEEYDRLTSRYDMLVEKGNKTDKKEISQLFEQINQLEQRGVKRVVYVDTENTLDASWATILGVNTDELILIRPEDQTAEQVLQMIIDIIKTDGVILLVLDSVPMLVPQQIYDESLEKKSYCGVAAPLTDFSKRITPVLNTTNTALVCINQMRDDLNNVYNQYHTPGGRAFAHLHSLRLYCRKGDRLNEKYEPQKVSYENPVAHIVDCRIVKTKICKPDRLLSGYTLHYRKGVDAVTDTISMAIYLELIKQAGAWFNILDPDTDEVMVDDEGNELKFQGKANLTEYLRNNENIMNELSKTVLNMITLEE